MKICILMGSPRKNGNTATLLKPFIANLEEKGAEIAFISLPEKKILPCKNCCSCQEELNAFGCIHEDDMEAIASEMIDADCFILATPIYAWHCAGEMKLLLDRCAYGMNKFYGKAGTASLWKGKSFGIITTSGYRESYSSDLFEESMKRFAKHSGIHYLGMYAKGHHGNTAIYQSDEIAEEIRQFAEALILQL